MKDVILELTNITKIFPGVKALDNVSFQLKKGEIHALMGENGAGKSTFIKVVTGVHQPNSGEIILNGKKVVFKSPKDAQKCSIAAIYQHGTVYHSLSITENVFMGHHITKGFLKKIDWKTMHKKTRKLLKELSSDLDPKTLMSNLTVAEQQIVEIAKAISTNAKIIIMDEPTASLSNRECENLYKTCEQLKDEGVSIIFISHRFEDMYRLAERVTIFRDGKYIGTHNVDNITNSQLIANMVGREITDIYPPKNCEITEEVLRVEKLNRKGYFKDISFSLKKGEILGLTGLVGAGRSEIVECIYGVEKLNRGKIFLNNKEVKINKPLDAMNYGIGLLPEDRQKQGLILQWEIYRNITICNLNKFTTKTVINKKLERTVSKNLGEKMALKAPSVFDKVSTLSGGNQQKVVVCKLLNLKLKVLILDEPTKGVDVGAKTQIYEIINSLAKEGYGIIIVSSDMPEVLGMSDRILVVHEGKLTGEFSRDEANQEKILEAAMNITKKAMGGGE